MTTLITKPTVKPGSYASTWAIAGATKYTAICRVDREIPDSQPSRDSDDVMFSVTIGCRQFLRRRSELKPLDRQLMK